jgi:predicted alpha/beta-hydrolase family hydrolase
VRAGRIPQRRRHTVNRPITSAGCDDDAVARSATVKEIDTPSGLARAYITRGTGAARGLAVLGHGAGGGVDAPDLLAVTAALVTDGWTVARVEQPYRVRGQRAPESAPRLDAAWVAVVGTLRRRRSGALLVAGRSSGARVACRTAAEVGAAGVVALAFPLHPPGKPEKSRVEELVGVAVPVLVVQGERDPFGTEAEITAAAGRAPGQGRSIVTVPGDHSLRQATDRIAAAVVSWAAGIAQRTGVLDRP